VASVWHEALCILAEYSPPAYWEMANGASFWWNLQPGELGADRFTTTPFDYDEIVSIRVFNVIGVGNWAVTCDWVPLRSRLLGVGGVRIAEYHDIKYGPAMPPNQMLHLTRPAMSVPGSS